MFLYKNQKLKTKIQKYRLNIKRYLIFLVCVFGLWSLVFGLPDTVFASEITEGKLIELTNYERTQNGLSPLLVDPLLYFAAHVKAQDMADNHYFDHYTLGGKSPWAFMNEVGYNHLYAGENLAMDFRTSEGIHKAWMNSPAHRENILNSNYEDIAVAVIKGKIDNHKTTLVVEMFAKKDNSVLGKINSLTLKITAFILGQGLPNKF